MSGSTSKDSQTSKSSLGEGFGSVDSILAAWSRGLRPDADLTVSEWADRHRMLAARVTAEPGRYRTDRTPYMREIMDALSPSDPAQRVVFMKGAQVGATEAGNNWIGFVIHHAPAPMMSVMPTVELAKRNSRQRIDTLIEESPALKDRVMPARARDSGNTMLSKDFPGGVLVMTGANSAAGLRSMAARYVFFDEVDAYPSSADDEGDPIALAEARTSSGFRHRRKVFMVSTPTTRGTSRIEREYDASDQRRYFVPCPHCGHMQWLWFERLRWEKNQPETAAYHCDGCEKPIAEHHKVTMLARGEWRATAKAAQRRTVGYHISALYSPVGWYSWSDAAAGWEAAQGSDDSLRAFRNTVLGETWFENSEAPEWERLAEQRESDWDCGVVPASGLFLTAGADVQQDRIEVDIWAWGRGMESWLVDHIVLDGGPGDPSCWDKLTALVNEAWPHENGAHMRISKFAIDTGYESQAVYTWARRQGFTQVVPIKGVEGFNRAAPVSGPTYVDASIGGKKLRRGARLWTVAVSTFKAETYRLLRLSRPTHEEITAGIGYAPGTIHISEATNTEWLKQLVGEQLVTVRRKRGGAGHLEWQKIRERNEALDCRVYARAAAWIAGIDRWTEHKWAQLEEDLGVGSPKDVKDEPPSVDATDRAGRMNEILNRLGAGDND